MSRIAVVGSINTDFVVRTGRFPRPGETILGDSFAVYGGGKGANQAIAAARLGANVEFFGAVGTDANSAERLAALRADGVGTTNVVEIDGFGGVAVIEVEEASGQNSIVLVPGANGQVTVDRVRAPLRNWGSVNDVVCLQLEIPLETVEMALTMGRACGALNVLNAAPLDPRIASTLGLVDVLIVNEIEAGQLLGRGPVKVDEVAAVASRLRELGVRDAVIVTLGDRGAWLSDDDSNELIPARRVPVVDTTGAGDAFCGAFCAWQARGSTRLDAVKVAAIVGSLSVQKPGAQPSLPTLNELKEALSGA